MLLKNHQARDDAIIQDISNKMEKNWIVSDIPF